MPANYPLDPLLLEIYARGTPTAAACPAMDVLPKTGSRASIRVWLKYADSRAPEKRPLFRGHGDRRWRAVFLAATSLFPVSTDVDKSPKRDGSAADIAAFRGHADAALSLLHHSEAKIPRELVKAYRRNNSRTLTRRFRDNAPAIFLW